MFVRWIPCCQKKLQDQFRGFSEEQNIFAGPQLRVAWLVFADAFGVEARETWEARETSINCTSFSVPSFSEFLNPAHLLSFPMHHRRFQGPS